MEGTETAAFSVSRFLLKPGRSYEANPNFLNPELAVSDFAHVDLEEP